ncbi:MAG: succinate dehydrogenase cytochrome b subunit [bacterium]|nr:succinate dehydrogenase cytochrome b subunit [bacterium]
MNSFGSIAWSSVGKKVITGITGLALFGFVAVHLIGNLTLFIGPGAFNEYAHFLETAVHGGLIYAFEAVLIPIFLFHIISAFTVAWTDRRAARKVGYKSMKNAGGKSRKSFSSTTMIYTGILVMFFVVGHIFLFKFADHEVDANGVKNLYKTVVTTFKGVGFTAFTVLVMILLGFHLRHGFWSAFQSIGWANDKYLPILEKLALVFAILLTIGFVIIPVYLFLNGDPSAVAGPGGH